LQAHKFGDRIHDIDVAALDVKTVIEVYIDQVYMFCPDPIWKSHPHVLFVWSRR